VEYTEDLSRWTVLNFVFAIPHYACLAGLTGLIIRPAVVFIGLLPALLLITAVLLLFTGKYRQDIFKLVMGINRWSFRVCAYALMLTHQYPPFSLSE
jgi:hypothetical protein